MAIGGGRARRPDQAAALPPRGPATETVFRIEFRELGELSGVIGRFAATRLRAAIRKRLKTHFSGAGTPVRVHQSGRDSFAVLTARRGEAWGDAQVAGLMAGLSEPFKLGRSYLYLTPRVGIAYGDRPCPDTGELFSRAATALSTAKQPGPDNVTVYSEEVSRRAARRTALKAALWRALEREELEVYYQPQVHAEGGRIVAVEALLRWNSPRFGTVCPDEFIPLAEECGLIVSIGEFVLERACRQAAAWQRVCPGGLRVAVNVSAHQLNGRHLLHQVERTLAESGLSPRLLELEMTESALVEGAADAAALFARLNALGVRIALDDFGTGYSSLSYLHQFPVQALKIDRHFVGRLASGERSARITDAIIAMAKSLALEVIAEGVETDAQRAYLTGRRCDLLQGYLFSQPRTSAEITAELAARAA